MSKWYRTGTVTVTSGSDQVTGVATYWDSAADKPVPGDIFTDNSGLYEVNSIESDGALTLDRDFEGFTQVNQPYAIIKVISQNGMTRVAGQVSDVLAELGDKITVSTSAPASSQGKDGDIWVVVA
tara:strand:+ start:380 stop:754 length:375 start_codon:yes stop_codon:yes gene_type:complete